MLPAPSRHVAQLGPARASVSLLAALRVLFRRQLPGGTIADGTTRPGRCNRQTARLKATCRTDKRAEATPRRSRKCDRPNTASPSTITDEIVEAFGYGRHRTTRDLPETWTNRDLPVLRAAVEIFGRSTRSNIPVSDIEQAVGFDNATVQQALRFLHTTPPYFEEEASLSGHGGWIYVGRPTGEALRVAGVWPTPENLLERLIAAFQAASEDTNREESERRRFKESAEFIRSGSPGSPVALQTFGGADAKIIS